LPDLLPGRSFITGFLPKTGLERIPVSLDLFSDRIFLINNARGDTP
jgi:hypothetical protein